MKQRQLSQSAERVAALRERIERWRRGARGVCPRMPNELWDEAVALAAEGGSRATARLLGVSSVSLDRRMSRGVRKSASAPVATFVPIGPLPSLPSARAERPEAAVAFEFTSADGGRLRIELPSATSVDVVNLARLWLERRA